MFLTPRQFLTFLLLTLFSITIPQGIAAKESQTINGIFWGNFDPPTLAHKEIVLQALETLKLRKIIIVVNDSQTKSYHAPISARIAMIKLMLYGLEEKIQVIAQNESAKADYQTIKKSIPGKLYAIAGQDSYEKWQLTEGFNLADYDGIVIIPRGRRSMINIPHPFKSKLTILQLSAQYRYFSSTKIREKLYHNRCVGLDPSICNYIQEHGLYKKR